MTLRAGRLGGRGLCCGLSRSDRRECRGPVGGGRKKAIAAAWRHEGRVLLSGRNRLAWAAFAERMHGGDPILAPKAIPIEIVLLIHGS